MGNKVKQCYVFDCRNSELNSTLRFYCFPRVGKTNLKRVALWAQFAQPDKNFNINDLIKLRLSLKFICSAHFKEDCFQETRPDRLNIFCIPTIRTSRSQPVSSSSDSTNLDLLVRAGQTITSPNPDFNISTSMEPIESSSGRLISQVTSLFHLTASDTASGNRPVPVKPNISSPNYPSGSPFTPTNSTSTSPLQELKASKLSAITRRQRLILKKIRKRQKEIKRLKDEYKMLANKTNDSNILSVKDQTKFSSNWKGIMLAIAKGQTELSAIHYSTASGK